MANSILGSRSPVTNGGPVQLMQQFNQFRQQIGSRDPQQMVQQLLQSGQMSQQQYEQLRQQAQGMLSMFRR